MLKVLFVTVFCFLLSACSVTPYDELSLDTSTNITPPSPGMAGVYVYQWKTGPLGAGFDVDFEVKGKKEVSLNTGEYAYFEIEPGDYEYKLQGGLFPTYIPVTFKAGYNYFFRAVVSMALGHSFLISDQKEIDEAKEKITSGYYELNSVD